MGFSDAQVQFIRSLRDRLRNERGEGPAISSSITRMQQERFYEVIDIAAHDAEEAAKLARKLTMWGIRLMPYFTADPALTVDDAIDAYWRHQHPYGATSEGVSSPS